MAKMTQEVIAVRNGREYIKVEMKTKSGRVIRAVGPAPTKGNNADEGKIKVVGALK